MNKTQPLPPVVKSLGVVSLFNDFASEMIYPLLPALMTTLGGGAISLGLLDGISDAISAGAKLVAGKLADRVHLRRALVIAGYGVAALVRPVIGVAGQAWQVIALRATDRIGKGVRGPARDAVIADATSPEIRGKAFGFHRSMDHAGAVIGPIVGWALISQAAMKPSQVIQWSVVPGVIAVFAVLWAMKKVDRVKGGPRSVKPPQPASDSVVPDRSSSIVFYLIVLFWLLKFPETLFLLRLQDVGLPVAVTPLIWAALHVVRTSATYPGGKLSDRLGPKRTMLGGWVIYAVVCVGLATAHSAGAAAAWFLLFGAVAALTEPPERAFVSNLKSKAGTGSRFGVYYASIGIAALVGGVLFGFFYSRSGASGALMASAIGTVALVVTGALAGWMKSVKS